MTEKIKVLEVLHGLAQGGIESFVMSICENIDKEKFQIDYALATDYEQFHEQRVLGCVVNRFVLYYANVKKGYRENGECIRTT